MSYKLPVLTSKQGFHKENDERWGQEDRFNEAEFEEGEVDLEDQEYEVPNERCRTGN